MELRMTRMTKQELEEFMQDAEEASVVEMFIRERLGLPPMPDSLVTFDPVALKRLVAVDGNGNLLVCHPPSTIVPRPDLVAKHRDSILKRLGETFPDHKFEFPNCQPSELFPDITIPKE